jgi:hypothetical protein
MAESAEFFLGSAEGSYLRLVAGGPDWPLHFWAELHEPGLECRLKVSAWDPSGINKFSTVFKEMSDASRGWEGEKVWRSTEGELELRFQMNPTGQIAIEVALRDPYRWMVETQLSSQSGESLRSLAKSAEKFQAMLEHAA